MAEWRMAAMCDNCPFAKSGKGKFLRRTLHPARWRGILRDLRHGAHFHCHKTTEETGDGSTLICAGAIEWQTKHGCEANLVRVMERIDWLVKIGHVKAAPGRKP